MALIKTEPRSTTLQGQGSGVYFYDVQCPSEFPVCLPHFQRVPKHSFPQRPILSTPTFSQPAPAPAPKEKRHAASKALLGLINSAASGNARLINSACSCFISQKAAPLTTTVTATTTSPVTVTNTLGATATEIITTTTIPEAVTVTTTATPTPVYGD